MPLEKSTEVHAAATLYAEARSLRARTVADDLPPVEEPLVSADMRDRLAAAYGCDSPLTRNDVRGANILNSI